LCWESVPAAQEKETEMPEFCTYSTYQWSVTEKKAVHRRKVRKKYSKLTTVEKAPDYDVSGCTVCREDQVDVAVEGLPTVRVCLYYAPKLREALELLAASKNFKVEKLVGYRVGQTRGRVVDGKRTGFSNHSYGTAIDINSASNGLYRRCDLKGVVPNTAEDIKQCKKGIGGIWNPAANPLTTITPESPAYKLFTSVVGWKWGGEIEGRLKDFMHFSSDGR
jgi:hypothetical protein